MGFPLIGTAGSPTAKHVLYGGASTTATVTGTAITTGALAATTFAGLPVVGFAVQAYNNGTLTDGAWRERAVELRRQLQPQDDAFDPVIPDQSEVVKGRGFGLALFISGGGRRRRRL